MLGPAPAGDYRKLEAPSPPLGQACIPPCRPFRAARASSVSA
jgi:hypothetical protein